MEQNDHEEDVEQQEDPRPSRQAEHLPLVPGRGVDLVRREQHGIREIEGGTGHRPPCDATTATRALRGVQSISRPPPRAETMITASPDENDPVRVFR
jgi:hypothetical protein